MTPLVADVDGEALAGWLHGGQGTAGALIVAGGGQTRAGPHRLFLGLSQALSAANIPSYRFDRRGIGDSGGHDTGFRSAGADIAAAAAAFRAAQPQMRTLVGIGLCDGATALLMAPGAADRLILLNPWTLEDDTPPSAVETRAHYRRRFAQAESWKRLLRGDINPAAAMKSLLGAARRKAPAQDMPAATLEADVMRRLAALPQPPAIILSDRDRTAQAFRRGAGRTLPARTIPADHAFSGAGERAALLSAVLEEMRGFSAV